MSPALQFVVPELVMVRKVWVLAAAPLMLRVPPLMVVEPDPDSAPPLQVMVLDRAMVTAPVPSCVPPDRLNGPLNVVTPLNVRVPPV